MGRERGWPRDAVRVHARPTAPRPDVDKQTCDRLFQTFDPDGSGEITLIELQASLRAMAPTQTGAGKADAKASKKKSKPAKTKPQGPTVDTALVKALAETEPEVHDNDDDDDGDEPKQFKGASVVARLREALARVGTRVVDVFKQWDYNGDGQISREEFNMAMPLLGVRASPAELEQLFAIFDPDRSGTVDYRELNAQLRHITATGAHTKPLTHSPCRTGTPQESSPTCPALRRSKN